MNVGADENICDLNYYMKNLVVKSNSIEEHSVYVEAQIGIECFPTYTIAFCNHLPWRKWLIDKRRNSPTTGVM